MPIQLGAHVDQVNPIEEAAELGAEIVQIHLGDPQSWQGPEIRYPGGAAALKADARAAGVGIYVHSPYIINVASTNNRIRIPSRKILQRHVSAAAEIGALGVVVHGGHVTADDDPGAGYVNWFKAVDGLRLDCPILIENTAGGKHAMARHVTGIERLWAAIGESENVTDVGFCLDTCHAHASGEPLDGLVGRIRAITGRIDLVHVNDSRDPAGSGNDRHANLGDGQLDPAELIALVKAAGAPSLLETPGGVPDRLADLAWLAERI